MFRKIGQIVLSSRFRILVTKDCANNFFGTPCICYTSCWIILFLFFLLIYIFHPLYAAVGAIDLEKYYLSPFIHVFLRHLYFLCYPVFIQFFQRRYSFRFHGSTCCIASGSLSKRTECLSVAEIFHFSSHLWNITLLWEGRRFGTLETTWNSGVCNFLCGFSPSSCVNSDSASSELYHPCCLATFQVGGREKMQVCALSIHCE